MLTDKPLSAEEKAAEELATVNRQARLDAFAGSLAQKRKDAVDGRAQSGIEDIWLEDEEFYEGVDDANRSEESGQTQRKPVNQTGSADAGITNNRGMRSTVFLNITRPYVDFSAGRAADMLLPTDDRAWELKPTPMPDIAEATKNQQTFMVGGITKSYGEVALMMLEDAKKSAEAAQRRIEDWHVESQFHAEQRKILKDAAKVGTGILKGPFPTKRKARAITREQNGTVSMKVMQETKPASKRISYWDFYPDPACGDSIHNGSYVWEKDRLTARQLRNLKDTMDADGQPIYIESAIDACLEEGPQRKYENVHNQVVGDDEQFEIWYYTGIADAEDLIAAGCTVEDLTKVFDVVVTMVNDRVIKASLSHLDSGEFPYDVMVWQPQSGTWTGIGVARQVRTPQRMINAGARNMMDNAGLAAGPQILMRRKAVTPADGVLELKPRKFWFVNENENVTEVQHAFSAVTIPMMQQELMAIIQFAMKMAEDVTGLPLLMQGQQGDAPDTVGGMTMLQNNSSTVLRSIAKTFDDLITEPHIRRYYEYLLLYGPDPSEKNDFVLDARGSSALYERDAQNQAILQMSGIVKDPEFGINPKKWFKEAMLAQRLDPNRFQYTPEEQEQVDQQRSQAPGDPRIAVAQIRAQSDKYRTDKEAQVDMAAAQMDTDRDTVYVQSELARSQATVQAKQSEMETRERIAMLEYANRRQISLDQAKSELAQTAMKLQTQERLAGMDGKGPQVAAPPTEPPGRAPAGEAYQR